MNKTLTSLSAAVLVALAGNAYAAAPELGNDLRAQVAKSDLVFVGSVIDVAYAAAAATGADQGIPHTFVTYEIERVLQGDAGGKHITLRFIGGRGEESAFLAVSGQPMFDLQDRDVLMVSGNGLSACPLVDCSDGRYRLIGDMAFSEEGQAIESDGKGGALKKGFFELEEVMTHQVSQTTMQLVDQFDAGESRVAFEKNASRAAHLSETQLIEQIGSQARALGQATPALFRSADIKAAFSLNMVAEAAPTERVEDAGRQVKARTEQERAEEAALRANGGNPVITSTKD